MAHHSEEHAFYDTHLVNFSIRGLVDEKLKSWLSNAEFDTIDTRGKFQEDTARLATLLCSESSFQIFRRFKWLSTCCLLETQRQLIDEDINLRGLTGQAYENAIERCMVKLGRYNQLLEQQNRLLSYDKPDWTCLRALHLFIFRRREMRNSKAYSWTLRTDDLLVLDPDPPITILAWFIDLILSMLPNRLFPSFLLTNSVDRRKDPKANYISPDRANVLVTGCSILIGLVFILVPIGQLFFHGDWTKWQKFGRIIGWSVGFVLYLWAATSVRLHESFVAALSYCAILVVFLGLKG